jgi:alcohol dehydrogenase, propanol-preferring
MRAMVLEAAHTRLRPVQLDVGNPGPGEVLVQVHACAVCRTDLHIVDAELANPKLPLIPGHEIVGIVEAVGSGVTSPTPGQRVGIPWLGWTCGACEWCTSGRENLCPQARFTGYQIDGGYAEFTIADSRYCLTLPHALSDAEAAPLLCAGLIGYRAYRAAGDGQRLGLYGFGAAAHLVAQVAVAEGREVYAFTRPGDRDAQQFALDLGAVWAGGSDLLAPQPLHAAILFAPVGALVPAALRAVRPAGTVVCAGIHMSAIPTFPYDILWGERIIRSVANLTRRDGVEFLALAERLGVRAEVAEYPLSEANEALLQLREGRVKGAAVLRP